MARSATPGGGTECGGSMPICQGPPYEAMRPPPLAIRACACFEQRVRRPLAIRDRRRYERRVTASSQRNAGSAELFRQSEPWHGQVARENLCYLAAQNLATR